MPWLPENHVATPVLSAISSALTAHSVPRMLETTPHSCALPFAHPSRVAYTTASLGFRCAADALPQKTGHSNKMKLIPFYIIVCLLTACEKQNHSADVPDKEPAIKTEITTVTTGSEKEPCCSAHPSPEAAEASEDSIYRIESTWKDDTGAERKLKSLSERVQVISMGYSTCKFACPRLLADMAAHRKGTPGANPTKHRDSLSFPLIQP